MAAKILYVEDSPDDITLLQLAFRKGAVQAQLEVATDGEQAIKALKNGAAAVTGVVLLDMKLPGLSGLQVLSWIREQPHLKRLPVIMFSSSSLPADINQAYDFGANSYLVKPASLDGLIELARTIEQYWLRLNTPPTGSA
jgi:CheY-like chemotaxis protein